jgi:hypothetical protein
MAQEGYTVWAYSKSANERVRELELTGTGVSVIRNRQQAQQRADGFATRMKKMRREQDWVGEIKWERMGIETVPGYLGSIR